MFAPNDAKWVLITGCLAVALLAGCGKPPEPCMVDPAQIESVQGELSKAERDLDKMKAELKDLEAELKAKEANLRDLEARKAELEMLKDKVEEGRPPQL